MRKKKKSKSARIPTYLLISCAQVFSSRNNPLLANKHFLNSFIHTGFFESSNCILRADVNAKILSFWHILLYVYQQLGFWLVFWFVKTGELLLGLSPISFVLWRRNVPDRIVTKPHNSVTICDVFCESQSCCN